MDIEGFPYGAGGTCFVLKYRNAFYVLTARHCVKDILPDTIFIQDKRNSKVSLPLKKLHTGVGDEYGDPLYTDYIIMEVAGEKIERSVVEQIECFHLASLKPLPSADLIHGRLIYRGFLKKSAAEVSAEIDYDKQFIRWLPLQGEAVYAGPSDVEAVQKMSLVHLPDEVTDLDGLSGSPVFNLTKLADGRELCRLAGMIITGSRSGTIAQFIDTSVLYSALRRVIAN